MSKNRIPSTESNKGVRSARASVVPRRTARSTSSRSSNRSADSQQKKRIVHNHREKYPLPPLPGPPVSGNRKTYQTASCSSSPKSTAIDVNTRRTLSMSSPSSVDSSGRSSTRSTPEVLVDRSTRNAIRHHNNRQGSFSSEGSGDDKFVEDRQQYSSPFKGQSLQDSSGEERFSDEDSNCYNDNDEHMESESSGNSMCHREDSPESRHDAAVRREEDRVLQRRIFHENKGFVFNVNTASAIKRVLKEKIFPKIKILSGREQDYLTPDFVGDRADQSRLICEKIVLDLDLDDHLEDKIRFWITYRKMVKNQLVKYRSNCVEDLKREYFKVKEMLENPDANEDPKQKRHLEGADELMTILSKASEAGSPLISLRNDDSKKLAFFFFAREFLPCVVKRLYFRQNRFELQLSEFVTVSDEAFTLLVLENNVARWNAMFTEGTNRASDKMPPQKYQSFVDDSKNGGGKDGYSTQATRRYNEYFDMVEEARKEPTTLPLEYELMKRMEALNDGKKYSNKKSKRKRDGELNHLDEDGSPLVVRFDRL